VFARIGKPFREVTELVPYGKQSAIRRFQPLVDRSLETVHLAAFRRCQAEAPGLWSNSARRWFNGPHASS
jgi:hypothetical protein